jgi:hypothetical protein
VGPRAGLDTGEERITFYKIPPSVLKHFVTRVRTAYSITAYSVLVKMQLFSQHSYNVNINSHNGQLTLHTDSHMEGRTILGSKSNYCMVK